MATLARKKARRSGLRTYSTATTKTIEEYLDSGTLDSAIIAAHKKTLLSIVEQLTASYDDVSKSLDPNDIETDVVESMRFVEPV